GRPRDREGDRDARAQPEDAGDRRRHRDAGPARRAADAQVRLRPGLALLQAHLPRRRERAPPAGNPLVERHFFGPKDFSDSGSPSFTGSAPVRRMIASSVASSLSFAPEIWP